jgi:hypothetical protein
MTWPAASEVRSTVRGVAIWGAGAEVKDHTLLEELYSVSLWRVLLMKSVAGVGVELPTRGGTGSTSPHQLPTLTPGSRQHDAPQ